MLTTTANVLEISEVYDIPPEDVLFLDFSLSGASFFPSYVRIRFEFVPEDRLYFRVSRERSIKKYFFALPNTPNSVYMIDSGCMLMNGEIIGIAKKIEEDTCDSSYFRRKRTVLNLNPVSKSLCHGCKFCHTIQQTPRDRKSLTEKSATKEFIEEWLINFNLSDLSHLIQVSIVTGCFGDEQKVIDYLKMIRRALKEYGFKGTLFYYGSEVTSISGLDELKEVVPFSLCLSVECFASRDTMLKRAKGRLTIDDVKKVLGRAKANGFETSFSYILGIESLEILEQNLMTLLPFINCFPTINIFQVHRGQEFLRIPRAWDIDYYLRARKIIEGVFMETSIRPRPWENYRGLWHLKFGKEELNDIRTPS